MKPSSRGAFFCLISAVVLIPLSAAAEPVPLKRVVELALSHATGGAIAAADEQRAAASYRELHDSYIPQVTVGAGLGPPSYGFPLSIEGQPPSLFNVNAQSALLNLSLREFLRAAKADSAVASLRTKDERNEIIQDAAVSYAELAKWEQRLARLQERQADANKMEAAVAERVKEGVDSEIEGTRARLSAARVRLRIAEAHGSADVLREHLSKLTGLPATSIETDPDSIPASPATAASEDAPKAAADSSPAAQAAVEHARAQYLRARGEHKDLWPSFDLAAQYALLSNFNNFENYYIPSKPCIVGGVSVLCTTNSFRQNNASVGVSIRFPILNFSQRARAKVADAEAMRADLAPAALRGAAAGGSRRGGTGG
jgi:outer membrane protein TolC